MTRLQRTLWRWWTHAVCDPDDSDPVAGLMVLGFVVAMFALLLWVGE